MIKFSSYLNYRIAIVVDIANYRNGWDLVNIHTIIIYYTICYTVQVQTSAYSYIITTTSMVKALGILYTNT